MPQNLNRSGVPIKRDQVAPPRRVDVDQIEETLNSQQAQIYNKANASTVGGLATAMNGKASQSSVDALADTVATKADVFALTTKANASDVTTALAGKADASALATKANVADIPKPASVAPKSEAINPAIGSDAKYAREDHQHQRLTSTTKAAIVTGSTVQLAFTRPFTSPPGITCTEIPPDTGAMSANPATFRVESWVREIMTPTPSGAYTGCVIKVWRSRPLPTMTPLSLTALLTAVVTGVNALIASLTNYDIFGASAVGTTFSCIAVQRSDVA